MSEANTPLSKASTYQQIGEYWDDHDLSDVWDMTREADLEVEINSEAIYYPVEHELSDGLRVLAARRGVSAETLLNLWLQDRIRQEAGVSSKP